VPTLVAHAARPARARPRRRQASNRDIAERLFIARRSVAAHVSNILSTTGTASRTEAARLDRRAGVLDDELAPDPDPGAPMSAIPELAPTAVAERGAEVYLLDVREADEWHAGRIDGAVHIPMGELPARLDELAGDKPVVAVCRSGNRSAHVTAFLRAQGLDAYNLRGGMKAWRDADLPFTAPDGRPGRVA
jgi:rhodanese-related sulfurtransferase